MYPGEEKKKFIKIIEELTAIIEHNPEETIKTALIEGIKAKTQDLKQRSQQKPTFTIKTNNLGFAEGKEREEAQEIKDNTPQWAKDIGKEMKDNHKTGPQPREEEKTQLQPELIRFGEYIKSLNRVYVESKPMTEHYKEFNQS